MTNVSVFAQAKIKAQIKPSEARRIYFSAVKDVVSKAVNHQKQDKSGLDLIRQWVFSHQGREILRYAGMPEPGDAANKLEDLVVKRAKADKTSPFGPRPVNTKMIRNL